MRVRHRHVRLRSRRSGITLLEVLISIGVLSVGLLGVASLLPLAKNYMAEGSKFDRAAALGHQALHDLEVRTDLLDPTKWMAPAGSSTPTFLAVCPASPVGWPVGLATLSSPSDTYNYKWYTISPVQTIPAAPFILDPLACAYPSNLFLNSLSAAPGSGGASNFASTNSSLFGPIFFPPSAYSLDGAGTPGSPALARISVAGTSGTFLPFSMAEKIFRSTDDVVFELPSDPAQRPFAPFSDVNNTPAANLQQSAPPAGDYSWFAVIDNVQRPWNEGPDQAWGNAGVDDNGDGVVDDIAEAGWPVGPSGTSDDLALWDTSGGQLWKVWIVVVQKRNLALSEVQPGATPGTFSFTPPTGTMTYVPPERMVYCDFLTAPIPAPANPALVAAAGQGGGDVEIYLPTALTSGITPTAEWLAVKPNQWIMMSAWPNLQSNLAVPAIRGQLAMVEWFRISSVGDIEPLMNGGTVTGWHRKLTLDGPDWNPYKFVDAVGASGVSPLPPLQFQSCYATIVDGVVGVYEATIEQGE